MSRLAATVLILAALALASAGCGSKTVTTTNASGAVATTTVPNVHFAKTKFALHLGVAFGAFHRYIYKPFKAGAFKAGAPGRVQALLKAGAAALFAAHELKTARGDALSDDHLRPLAEKVQDLLSRLGGLGSSLRGGALDAGAITGAAAAVSSLGSASGSAGAVVKELAPAL